MLGIETQNTEAIKDIPLIFPSLSANGTGHMAFTTHIMPHNLK